MPRDLEGLADVVVLTVKTAMAPVLERLALVEQENANLKLALACVPELRDRVVVVETKASMPLPIPVVSEVPPVDLSPLLARMSVLEQAHADTKSALGVVTDLRDRVVVVETKSAMPVAVPSIELTPAEVDFSPVLQQIDALKQEHLSLKTSVATVADVRDRLVAVEAKANGLSDVTLATAGVVEQMTVVRERVAALEARAPVAGPPGQNGADGQHGRDGKDGAPGRDGADGMTLDDLSVEQEDERVAVIKGTVGARTKEIGRVTFHHEIYCGIWGKEKSAYVRGDCVTWDGSEWHCNEPTNTKPGEASKAWTLKVKRGRDGKDGRNGIDLAPVVSLKR